MIVLMFSIAVPNSIFQRLFACLPKQWSQNMLYEDQCWVGKAMFVSKGNLSTKLKNWWFPPPAPAPNSPTKPNPDSYYKVHSFDVSLKQHLNTLSSELRGNLSCQVFPLHLHLLGK